MKSWNLIKIQRQKLEINFFKDLANFLNEKNLTILNIINTKVYDKVLNAKEYQLIKYKHFYNLLAQHGFPVSGNQIQGFESIITPFLSGTMEINSIMKTLAKYGSYELFPKSNKHINYKSKF